MKIYNLLMTIFLITAPVMTALVTITKEPPNQSFEWVGKDKIKTVEVSK